jgi:hypothetical protein
MGGHALPGSDRRRDRGIAAAARTSSQRLLGASQKEFVKEITQVAIGVLGLSLT